MGLVLFDLSSTQPSSEAPFHGGGEYAKFIFKEAVKRGYGIDVCYNPDMPLSEDVKCLLLKGSIPSVPFRTPDELKQIISESNYDVFFAPLPYEYKSFSFENTKCIFTIHGLRELEYYSFTEHRKYLVGLKQRIYHLYSGLFMKKRFNAIYHKYKQITSIKNLDILTVSKHSLFSLKTFYPGLQNNNITVCHPPIDFSVKNTVSININEKYFLLISANRWIKNNLRAIKALDELYAARQLEGYKVVVLGCASFPNSSCVINKDKFIIKGYVDELTLNAYMKNAYAFIYPSLNEGFGYPPVNAMKYGTPVLSSSFSSIPEVCKDAVLYFNPLSVSEMKNRILYLIEDDKVYRDLIKNGYKRVDELSSLQEQMLEKTLKIVFNG